MSYVQEALSEVNLHRAVIKEETSSLQKVLFTSQRFLFLATGAKLFGDLFLFLVKELLSKTTILDLFLGFRQLCNRIQFWTYGLTS